eukprot:scaffold17246_cov41-Phaeocystis_antarctica.AAC.4
MAYPPQGTYHGPTHPMAGINDPPVKLLMTGVNFFILYMLQLQEMLDPSETPRPQNVTADWSA